MLLNVDTLVLYIRGRIHVGPLIELLSLGSVALVFDLASKLAADELLALWLDLLGELERSEPVLQVHAHVEGELGLGALQEHVLSQIRLE